ncbi:hypothetical protein [Extibacter muris]|uniref:hypothetical protein n=1 Tax=Extibacter muris TaxID=1796622 RepID=UPI001D092647|nr:hypothetical protein [Extibacter muris]MCB6203839.1 hypothetical protein [Extibacter muris]MCQ4665520.1 hypothetical protein [Extibacter muris]MCQ4694918.1 hypothetical protein [Extibacter muris]
MEIKDIITIIGTLFSIAVAIKTLFFSKIKEGQNTININGNRNNAKIIKVDKKTNITNNKYVIPQNTSNNRRSNPVSTEEELLKWFGIIISVIIAIVLTIVFNNYIVSILSVLLFFAMLLNIRRTKKYQLSSQETAFIIIEHVVLSIIIFSMLYIPQPIKVILDQIKPINSGGLSLLVEWLSESGKLIWHSLQGNELSNVGIIILLRFTATMILSYTVINHFLNKSFIGLIMKFRENRKKFYVSHILFYVFTLLLLHSSFIYFPLKEILSPLFKRSGDGISDWLSR